MAASNKIKDLLTVQELRAISQFCDRLKKEAKGHIREITLFGSRARGEGDEDSDVDLLVILDKEDHQLKIKIWDIAYDIFGKTEIMISPLVLSASQFNRLLEHERLIALTIKKEGIRL